MQCYILKVFNKFVYKVCFILAVSTFLYSATHQSEKLFQQALDYYFAGEIKKAETLFEKAYKLSPEEKKYKTFLVTLQVTEAERYYNEKNYLLALEYITKASQIDPENKDVISLKQKLENLVLTKSGIPAVLVELVSLKEKMKTASYEILYREKIIEELLNKNYRDRIKMMSTIKELSKSVSEINRFKITVSVITIIVLITSLFLILYFRNLYKINWIEIESIYHHLAYIDQKSSVDMLMYEQVEKKIELVNKICNEEKDVEVKVKRLSSFLDDENEEVRAIAAAKLYEYDKEYSLKILKSLAQSSNKKAKLAAIKAFAEIGTLEVVEFLIQIYRESKDDNVLCSEVEKALDKIDKNKPIPESKKIKIEDYILDAYSRVRADRVELLEKELKIVKNKKVAIAVLSPFLKDNDNRTRANAVKAIYPYSPKLAMKTLHEMVHSKNKWFRLSSCWLLGQIRTNDNAKLLLKLLYDKEPLVRKMAMKMLHNYIDDKNVKYKLRTKIVDIIKTTKV